jgi:hypothetical protein
MVLRSVHTCQRRPGRDADRGVLGWTLSVDAEDFWHKGSTFLRSLPATAHVSGW